MDYRRILNTACWVIVPPIALLALIYDRARPILPVMMFLGYLLWRRAEDRRQNYDNTVDVVADRLFERF